MSHINNLSSFIKPVENKNTENSLKGVVTPLNQTYHKSNNSLTYDLLEIINNEDLLAKFRNYTFPRIEKTSDNTLFIVPTKRVISSLENMYIKWLVLDENHQPMSNHNYPMVPLPKKGYLMKIVLPVTSEDPSDFMIEYLVDYHNIPIQIISGVNNITQVQSSLGQSSIQVNKDDTLSVELFDMSRYPEVTNLIMNKNEFFKNYLYDMINE